MASHNTLDVKIKELLEAKQMHQNSRPKIQRVDEYLRNRNNFRNHYSPKFVSIGPIHHDNQNLKIGENYKLIWAAKYIQNTQKSPYFLHKKIADNIDELMSLFADDVLDLANTSVSLKGFCSLEEKLSWLLFVDGCFLLYIFMYLNRQLDDVNINIDQLDEQEQDMNIKADQLDEQEQDMNIMVDELVEPGHLNIKVDQLVLVMKDVLLLENQLPYLVLKLLWKNGGETELINTMKNFLKYYHWTPPGKKKIWKWQRILVNNSAKKEMIMRRSKETPYEPPTHLLDLQRKIILTESNPKAKKQSTEFSEIKSKMMTYRNIEDLTAVGINLRSSGTRKPTDVDFSEGWFTAELTLPQIVVDDDTAASFLNLIAYEMCPDFKNDYGICSFVVFMDSLIDHAEDVKKLRSKGILVNSLGRDEEVAELFNNISTDLAYNAETYFEIRVKIHEHHFNNWKIWLAQGYQTYFSNPWAITGFLAAFTALALTSVQTWFSIFPR